MIYDLVKVGEQVQRFYQNLAGGPLFICLHEPGRHTLGECVDDYMQAVSTHFELYHPEFGKFRLRAREGTLVLEVIDEGPENERLLSAFATATA